jgi:asparagine synthase (glutamine-hydrolysing)
MLDGPVDTVSVPELAEGYRAARAAGARTVLTGELAEYVLAMNQHVVPHLLLAGRWGAASRRLREERRRGNSWPATVRPHIVPMLPRGIARRYAHLRGRDAVLLPPWIDLGRVNGFEARPDLRVPARRRWAEAQLEPTGRGVTSPTLEADALCAAAVGVHVRRPFTDVDLWEFLLSLRAETKFPNRVVKVLLRRAMAGLLPAEILWRRDKTAFDDHIVATADWPELERWILRTPHRIVGVDYRLLGDRLSRRELSIAELKWARDVAQVHAFLSRWD